MLGATGDGFKCFILLLDILLIIQIVTGIGLMVAQEILNSVQCLLIVLKWALRGLRIDSDTDLPVSVRTAGYDLE